MKIAFNKLLSDSSPGLSHKVAALFEPFRSGEHSANATTSSHSAAGVKGLARGKSECLLEAACKVAHACYGGVVFLASNGESVENPVWGVPPDVAERVSDSRWLAKLLDTALSPTALMPLVGLVSDFDLGDMPPGLPAASSLLMIPLARPGRLQGALYLVRALGQPAFTRDDVETVLPISICLEQVNWIEEVSLEAQFRLLNRVAQEAAGNLDTATIFRVTLRELDRHLPRCVSAIWVAECKAPVETVQEGPTQRSPMEEISSSQADFGAGTDASVSLRLAAVSTRHDVSAEELGLVPDIVLPLAQTPFTPCWRDSDGATFAEWKVLGKEGDDRFSTDEADGAAAGQGSYPCFATPLRAGNRIVGILQSVGQRTTALTKAHVQLLHLVADLLGPSISNCQLFERLRVTYEELRTAQAHLIRAEKLRALGELASGMAHDFNNSLCGVLGFLEIAITDDLLSPAHRNHLERARACALGAAETVKRVQDFARMRPKDEGFLPVDLNELVRTTIELTRPKWETMERSNGKRIVVQTDTAATMPALGTVAELREVLTNLIFNAVDAMPAGGTLAVRTWSQQAAVLVSVADTGVGMSAAVQQRLFEPFFTTKGERGNGMGLSSAFGIVKHHGGEITAVSEVGRGSTFTLRLPAASAGASQVRRHIVSVCRTAPQPPAARSLRVLVVEDDEAICDFLNTILTRQGHYPCVKRTGTDGLQAFTEGQFDVVLTDMGLPGMSGQEMASKIAERSPGMPILLLTGWGDQIKSAGRLPPGVTRVVSKPVTIQAIAEVLQAVCSR